MPHLDWRIVARAFAGFLIGLLAWTFLSASYNGLLAPAAEATIRFFEKPQVTHLNALPDEYVSIDRTDFDPRSPHPRVPASDLTFNLLILTALFAAEKRPFRDKNILGFCIAMVLLYFTHVFGLITEVMSIYVLRLGPWSLANYGPIARNFWGVANHSYRLVLMYAFAFGLWFICRPKAAPAVAPAKKKKQKR